MRPPTRKQIVGNFYEFPVSPMISAIHTRRSCLHGDRQQTDCSTREPGRGGVAFSGVVVDRRAIPRLLFNLFNWL